MTTLPFSIGIVALSLPSAGPRRQRVKRAIGYLESAGLKVKIGKTVYASQNYRSADIRGRVEDLMSMFTDPDIGLILNTTGGYNSNELLEYLDYKTIGKNRKWFASFTPNRHSRIVS